mgnify:CR=1 FL=1
MIDSGNETLNVNLTANFDIPVSTGVGKKSEAARQYCMDPKNVPVLNYTVDITHAQSMAWIKNEGGTLRDAQKPFFLYESFTVPHAGGWGWRNSPGGTTQVLFDLTC